MWNRVQNRKYKRTISEEVYCTQPSPLVRVPWLHEQENLKQAVKKFFAAKYKNMLKNLNFKMIFLHLRKQLFSRNVMNIV